MRNIFFLYLIAPLLVLIQASKAKCQIAEDQSALFILSRTILHEGVYNDEIQNISYFRVKCLEQYKLFLGIKTFIIKRNNLVYEELYDDNGWITKYYISLNKEQILSCHYFYDFKNKIIMENSFIHHDKVDSKKYYFNINGYISKSTSYTSAGIINTHYYFNDDSVISINNTNWVHFIQQPIKNNRFDSNTINIPRSKSFFLLKKYYNVFITHPMISFKNTIIVNNKSQKILLEELNDHKKLKLKYTIYNNVQEDGNEFQLIKYYFIILDDKQLLFIDGNSNLDGTNHTYNYICIKPKTSKIIVNKVSFGKGENKSATVTNGKFRKINSKIIITL